MKKIIIFTDGASKGNPGPGGWGAVVVVNEEVSELGGPEKNTTNNRMELMAVIEALSFIEVENDDLSSDDLISIYTDSSYVLKGAKTWLAGWEKNNWQTKAKQDVLNKDLWQKLSTVMSGKKIDWHLVSGHVGIAGNERTDKISTDFADGQNPALFSGPISDYKIDILNIAHNSEAKEKRSGSKARSKAVAFSYVSKVGGKIEIHKTWAETEKRVKGAKGALYKKALSQAEEGEVVKEFEGR